MTTDAQPGSTTPDVQTRLQDVSIDAASTTEPGPIHIGVVTLNRPDKRNALTPTMLQAIPPAIDQLVASGARAIVIAGEGKVFCAGFDLSLCKDDDAKLSCGAEPVLAWLLRLLSHATAAMRACPVPVVVAAHGGAVAGACAILCAADIAVTDTQAKIGYPVVPLGISPAVSAPHLAQQTGTGNARARLLDPSLISGTRAHQIGLVRRLVESRDQVPSIAIEIAAKLAAKPPHALRATKALLNTLSATTSASSSSTSSNNTNNLDDALQASLSLVGGEEQRRLLATIWK